jgi:hypothetical protein
MHVIFSILATQINHPRKIQDSAIGAPLILAISAARQGDLVMP